MTEKPIYHDFPYEDDPRVTETFADGLRQVIVAGTTLRLTFSVARPEMPPPGETKVTGYKVPIARIVLPVGSIVDMYDQLTRVVQSLKEAGILKALDANKSDATIQ